MNKETLEHISALLAHARNLLDEMETDDDSEDAKENWLYQIESVEYEIDEIHRQAMNFPIQGYANEIFVQGKLKLYKAIKKNKLKSNILIHPELEVTIFIPI